MAKTSLCIARVPRPRPICPTSLFRPIRWSVPMTTAFRRKKWMPRRDMSAISRRAGLKWQRRKTRSGSRASTFTVSPPSRVTRCTPSGPMSCGIASGPAILATNSAKTNDCPTPPIISSTSTPRRRRIWGLRTVTTFMSTQIPRIGPTKGRSRAIPSTRWRGSCYGPSTIRPIPIMSS